MHISEYKLTLSCDQERAFCSSYLRVKLYIINSLSLNADIACVVQRHGFGKPLCLSIHTRK